MAPRANPGLMCPYWRKDVSKVCHTCPLYTEVRGTHPNTGDSVNTWQCAMAWIPIMLMENASFMRQNAAATESMRNEIVRRMDSPMPIRKLLES